MERRALLIFADPAHSDCKRRGWPATFRILLETQNFRFEQETDFDLHLFTSRGFNRLASSSLAVHFQSGGSFAERFENAIESLARLGYQEIVIVGQDCPDLEQSDILQAFELLREHRLVLGPDHRGGCYLIGIHSSDWPQLHGIHWQRNTDFRQLLDRFGKQAVYELPVKLDLDSLSDVWLLGRSLSRWKIVSELLRDALLNRWPISRQTQRISSIENQREHWQFPPPLTKAS